jgi:hypothetical protein
MFGTTGLENVEIQYPMVSILGYMNGFSGEGVVHFCIPPKNILCLSLPGGTPGFKV